MAQGNCFPEFSAETNQAASLTWNFPMNLRKQEKTLYLFFSA